MQTEHKPLDSNHFETCPHCGGRGLTDAQLMKIAEQAATRATAMMRSQFYQGIGAAVVNRFLWLMGAIAVAIILFFNPHSFFK